MNRIRIHPQSTLNSQAVHVDIFRRGTLDVGHAPGQRPKYSAIFLARPLRHQYNQNPPQLFARNRLGVFEVVRDGQTQRHTDLLKPSPSQPTAATKFPLE
jgi:hypothetical protein